jgi:hypothetical protein
MPGVCGQNPGEDIQYEPVSVICVVAGSGGPRTIPGPKSKERFRTGSLVMTVLQEIFSWAKDLPPWQGDALSRLLSKPALAAEDYEDLFALLKAEHAIPDPKNRVPTKLDAKIAPLPSQSGGHVQLTVIKNLVRVNAIAEAHKLPIGAAGLTVIYGDNGAGKSGYSRVLKKACRARDQLELILSNAHKPAGSAPAEADFEIRVNGTDKDCHWINGNHGGDVRDYIDTQGGTG